MKNKIGRREKITENEKGEKFKIEYGMLDVGDSSRAFGYLFGLAFGLLFLMVGIMGGNTMLILLVSIPTGLCLLGTIGSASKKTVRKLSKREFREEQIDDLIG
jgi:hypothetical protein